jgi:hypothetical protein
LNLHRVSDEQNHFSQPLNPRLRRPARDWRKFFLNRIVAHFLYSEFAEAWFELQDRCRSQCSGYPTANLKIVDNVNDPGTLDFIDEVNPDLVLVSGTNLVGKALIEKASRKSGILNLRVGLSPYMKGGPNCTNWCLAERTFYLIGNKVLWLDAGIDTGEIIATEQTPLDGSETLMDLHWKVMEHGHSLCVRSVKCLAAGLPVARVPQSEIAKGKIFYYADWADWAMRQALQNYRFYYNAATFSSSQFRQRTQQLKLVSLPPCA